VSEDRQRPARYRLTFGLDIPADLVAVQQTDPDALDAAQPVRHYRQVDEHTCHVLAIGLRDDHGIYRTAARPSWAELTPQRGEPECPRGIRIRTGSPIVCRQEVTAG
jgi:hypothetical protein